MLDSGMRDGEVVRMRIEHINWMEEVYFNPQGKTGKARRQVPLSKRVMALLRTRVNHFQQGWVFPSQKAPSGHIELRGLQKHFRRIAQQLGLPGELKLYCARHTFGTVAMAETRNPALVMETMGHEDLKTTMGYMHPELGQIKQIIDRRNAENQALVASGSVH
jgi:integrase/recombinase XerD